MKVEILKKAPEERLPFGQLARGGIYSYTTQSRQTVYILRLPDGVMYLEGSAFIHEEAARPRFVGVSFRRVNATMVIEED